MWQELGIALGLMLVLEGILPFLQPGRWRKMVAYIAEIDDTALRIVGLISMLAGTMLIFFLRKL